MRIYLTFNQNARLFGWLQKNRNLCKQVTGHDAVECIAIPIAEIDPGPLPYTHTEFPKSVQWWINKHCPYDFAKSGKNKGYHPLLAIKDWYYKRKKFMK